MHAAPRLRLLGVHHAEPIDRPEEGRSDQLADTQGNGARARYHALIGRLVSFTRAAAHVGRTADHHTW